MASACLGVLVLFVLYNRTPSLRLGFDDDHVQPISVVSGVGSATTLDGQRGAWITTRGILNLRGLDRRVPWRVTFAARAPSGSARHVTIWADAVPIASHDVGEAPVTIVERVPPRPSKSGLVLAIYTEPTGQTAGKDDLFLASLTAAPEGVALPPPKALVLVVASAAALAIGLVWLSWPLLAVLSASTLLATATALALARGLAAHTAFPVLLLTIVGTWAAALGLVRWLETRGWRLMAAGVVTAVALHLQLLVLLHPNVTYGDTAFHVHRLHEVAGGRVFFVSSSPGGEFPYPPALYVLVQLVQQSIPLGTADALRLTVAVTVALVGFVLYGAASAAWGARRALAGLVLYHLLPIGLGIQVYAFLTNAFANVLAAAALALVGWPRRTGGPAWWPAAVAVLLAVGTMLAHLSSAVILAGALVATALLCVRARDWVGAATACGVLVISAALSWGVYYSHFMPTYRQYLTTTRRAAAPPLPAQPPVMREEAHQTRWVPGWPALAARAAAVPRYVRRYYGLAGTALAALGAVVLWRGLTTRFDRCVLGTLLACAAFLALGVTTPIDLRYYAAAYPFMAFAGALGTTTKLRWGGSAVPAGLFALALAGAAMDWYRWLNTPDF